MSEQPAKKVRTPAQAAANQAARDRAKRVAEESAEFFAKYGLLARVPYPGMYAKMKKEGKTDDEIAAVLKQKQNNNAATRKAKTAAKATVVANEKPLNAAATASTTSAAPKVKTPAKEAADKAQSNTAKKFKNRNLKVYPQAVSYYIMQKKAGVNDETIFANIKARPNLQKPPMRTKKNNTAAKANAVAPLGVANKGAVANKVVVANKGVAKGSYVCEKCRLVANNTTRKNNNKKNNYSSNNFFPVNATNFNGVNI
jgi:hypothetical protein